MSSSPTETATDGRRHDAPDGRLRRRGHRRRVEEAARRLGRAPTRSSPRSRPTRSTPTSSRPRTGRVAEILVEVGKTVDVGRVMARIATDAKPGEAHASESGVRAGRRRPRSRWRRPARPESCPATRRRPIPGRPSGDPRGSPVRPRRYSPVVMRIAAEHGDRPRRRSTAPAAAAASASRTCSPIMEGNGAAERADAHREPVPAREPGQRAQAAPGRGACARGPSAQRRAALAHAPVDRPRDGRVAADRGDVHDDHRGRHDAGSRRARERTGLT